MYLPPYTWSKPFLKSLILKVIRYNKYICRYFINSSLQALREKEKGDWRLLRVDEKKSLYRSQYCQTFVEFQHVGSEWMGIMGWVLIHISLALWLFMLLHSFDPPLPESFKPSAVREQMKLMIDMQVNPITGISSKWDYEKNDWKNPGFFTPPNPFKDEIVKDDCWWNCKQCLCFVSVPQVNVMQLMLL